MSRHSRVCRSFCWETKIIELSLVGISPSKILVFLSSCYGGRASDKIITKDGDFYDFLERDDLVMGDRSFQFKKTYFLIFVIYKYLQTHGQSVRWQKKRYKRQKNLQVCEFMLREQLIEQRYRILKGVLSIIMIQHVECSCMCCTV